MKHLPVIFIGIIMTLLIPHECFAPKEKRARFQSPPVRRDAIDGSDEEDATTKDTTAARLTQKKSSRPYSPPPIRARANAMETDEDTDLLQTATVTQTVTRTTLLKFLLLCPEEKKCTICDEHRVKLRTNHPQEEAERHMERYSPPIVAPLSYTTPIATPAPGITMPPITTTEEKLAQALQKVSLGAKNNE